MDFKSNRHRLQSSEETFNRYATTPPLVRTDASVSSFDGASLRTSIDRDKKDVGKLPRADISIVKGYVKNYSGFNHWTYPLFLGHAILGRSTPGGGDYFPGNLRPDRDVFKLKIKRVAELDGAKCLVLRGRAGKGDEIWVDPEKQSAIVRIAQFSEGKVAGDLSIRYQKTPVGYFPQGWKWTRFHEFLDGRIESIEEMHVERMQVDPKIAESEFTMKEMPGMLIVESIQEAPADDHGRPRFVRSAWYRINADGVRREVNIPGE